MPLILLVPVFLLMGGEIVIAFILARIAVWVLRAGWRRPAREPGPPRPGGGGGGGGFRAPCPSRHPGRRAPPRAARARRLAAPKRRRAA